MLARLAGRIFVLVLHGATTSFFQHSTAEPQSSKLRKHYFNDLGNTKSSNSPRLTCIFKPIGPSRAPSSAHTSGPGARYIRSVKNPESEGTEESPPPGVVVFR